jgi:hypothetical protein
MDDYLMNLQGPNIAIVCTVLLVGTSGDRTTDKPSIPTCPSYGQSAPVFAAVQYDVGNKYFFRGSYDAGSNNSKLWNFTQTVVRDSVVDGKQYHVLQRSIDFRSVFPSCYIPPIDTGTVLLERSDSVSLHRYGGRSIGDLLLVDFRDSTGASYYEFASIGKLVIGAPRTCKVFGRTERFACVEFVLACPSRSPVAVEYEIAYLAEFGHAYYTFPGKHGGPSGISLLVGAIVGGGVLGDTAVVLSRPEH